VWAPAARAVRVVGDFNGWDGRIHPMRVLGSSGVWEMFVPGVEAGARYRFEVLSQAGELSRPAECSEALAHGSPTCCGCCLAPNGTTGAREAGH
jgi:1,4-alpha-glucan branching enzyme